jgi:hypothetical protein
MALPVPATTTCNIHRAGQGSPAVTGVPCSLSSDYRDRRRRGEQMNANLRFSHILLVDVNTDIRDGWADFASGSGNSADMVYIPDDSGTVFKVIFVGRLGRNTPMDCKRVYLMRTTPNWNKLY